MNLLSLALNYVFLYCIFLLFAVYATKYIIAIQGIIKNKKPPFFKLNLLEQIINIEILLLLLCIALTIYFYISNEVIILDTNLANILINIGCSIAATVLMSVIVYFKFLKHIPDETKKQIDNLLNERLVYETTNHNAVIQKSDDVRKSLSDEHAELRHNVISVTKELTSLSGKFDNYKEIKRLQYEYLNYNDKSIIENINNISSLGEVLKRVNYENVELKKQYETVQKELEKLAQENAALKEQLSQYRDLYQNDGFNLGL